MRGDVYEMEPRPAKGHEQAGDRFGVIVQTDLFPWSTVLVAPTSASARPTTFRPRIELGNEHTTVLVDQMSVVDPEYRLGRMVGRVSLREMQDIDIALAVVLGLS